MEMITTTKGLMDPSLLEKKTGSKETDNEITNWVEYWDKDGMIHRSVHVHLKKNIVGEGLTAILG